MAIYEINVNDPFSVITGSKAGTTAFPCSTYIKRYQYELNTSSSTSLHT